MTRRPLPDQSYLLQVLVYEPESGSLIWKDRPRDHFKNRQVFLAWNKKYAGTQAGSIGEQGYRIVVLDNIGRKASRVIWKMIAGSEPEEIDHENRDRSDNRWENLRSCTKSQNQRNASVKSTNETGLKGVRLVKKSGSFVARIRIDGKLLSLGTYSDALAAHAAYCTAAKAHFGEFWSGGAR